MAAITEVFDVEAAISVFLADPTRSCLELPHMTTGQRKQAKRIAEMHPQITCESFGFGKERQLHLFKNNMESALNSLQVTTVDPGLVNVKNTFIDDFVDGEIEESVIFRSMPPQLSKKETFRGLVIPSNPKVDSHSAPRQAAGLRSECSTNVSVDSRAPSVSMGSPASSTREVPVVPPLRDVRFTPPPGLEVRNTFIHFQGASANERSVQSMPHGMFGQCLREEALKANIIVEAAPPIDLRAPGASEGTKDVVLLKQGTEVVIQGLTKLPAFNGLSGVVQCFEEQTDRYNILLSTPACDGKYKTAKVKCENLLVIAEPSARPPSHTPSLMLDDFTSLGAGAPSLPATPMWDDVAQKAHSLKLTALV